MQGRGLGKESKTDTITSPGFARHINMSSTIILSIFEKQIARFRYSMLVIAPGWPRF